jgi:5'-nucleotidase
VERPNFLLPSAGFTYSYDLSRPAGQRLVDVRLNGEPLADERVYRVAMSNFLPAAATISRAFKKARPGRRPPGHRRARSLSRRQPPPRAAATTRLRNLTPQR